MDASPQDGATRAETVRWTEWDGTGLEHCTLWIEENAVRIESVVVGSRGGTLYGAHYSIRCDRNWRTREVRLAYAGAHAMHVEADGEGHWFDMLSGGEPIPVLDCCLDVDIGVTPFTNTLAMKRLRLAEGASRDILAAYVPLPSQIEGGALLPRPADQRYTCLQANRRYRYEGLFRGFAADLVVDDNGLVLDYPKTFRRVC